MKIMRWEEGHLFTAMGGQMRWVFWPKEGCFQLTLHYSVRLPGESFALHTHPTADDIVSVIQGRGKVLTADGELDIEAGQSVWIPAGELHGFKNTGDVPMISLGSQAPPDLEIYKRGGFDFS